MAEDASRSQTIDVPKGFENSSFSWSKTETKEDFIKWMGSLVEEVKNLRSELRQTKEQVAKLQKGKGSFSSLFQKPTGPVSESERNQVKAQKANIITTFTDEVKEQNRVGNNIIIRGIQASKSTEVTDMKKHDEDEVNKVLRIIGINDVVVAGKTRRITKFDGATKKRVQSETVQVQLCSSDEQTRILAAAKGLKAQQQTQHVYINKELTQLENEREYQLRQERRVRTDKLIWQAKDGRKFGVKNNKVFSWCIKFINGQRKVSEFWYNDEEAKKLQDEATKTRTRNLTDTANENALDGGEDEEPDKGED